MRLFRLIKIIGVVYRFGLDEFLMGHARVRAAGAIPLNKEVEVIVTYDGSGKPEGIKIFIEGEPQKLLVDNNTLPAGANIRTKAGGKTRLVHTLNGSGLATPRVLVSFLETHYTPRGTVRIPPALRPYLGGAEEIG